jgi:NAD(P)-dependent dehydrogenase (short-subunit alcohol dehydrogenase family)
MAGELSPKEIPVNVPSPGATRTPIWSRIVQNPDALTAREPRIWEATPTGRISEAEEITNTILFLASDEAANIQAAEILVAGGATGSPSGAPIYRG